MRCPPSGAAADGRVAGRARSNADRGYDHNKYRRIVRDRGITPRIARRGIAHGSGLGRTRWVVERGFAWLHAFKRLRTRYERRADIHLGLLQLACALICYRRLPFLCGMTCWDGSAARNLDSARPVLWTSRRATRARWQPYGHPCSSSGVTVTSLSTTSGGAAAIQLMRRAT